MMNDKKIKNTIGIRWVLILALLFLIGVYPVLADVYFYSLENKINEDYLRDAQAAMFSPAPGILVVQGLVEGPEYSKTPYCVDTNVFEITYGNGLTNNSFYDSKNPFGLKSIKFDLSQQSGSAPGNYQYNVLNAYINGVNYLIGSTAQKNLQLNAFKINDKGSNNWVGVWTGPKTIQYAYDNMLNQDVTPDYYQPYPQNSRYNHFYQDGSKRNWGLFNQ